MGVPFVLGLGSAGMQYYNGSYTSYFNRRHRPLLTAIAECVAADFGVDAKTWRPGTRHDDASRAVAAYLARRHFGYSVKEIVAALGYGRHSSVRNAILRVEEGSRALKRHVRKLEQSLAKA